MKGYKGFDKDLKCRGFQYEVGKTYEAQGEIALCENGFHFCKEAKNIQEYYGNICSNRYCEIKASGKIIKGDNKCVCSKITIVREIPLKEFLTLVNKGSNNFGWDNDGDYNKGDYNKGDYNEGDHNEGDYNKGDYNEGDSNIGHSNKGDSNIGNCNKGDNNEGNRNEGDNNKGNFNAGDNNKGDSNIGHSNEGDNNIGSDNRGDYDIGYFNRGNNLLGIFNTSQGGCIIFNRYTSISWSDIIVSAGYTYLVDCMIKVRKPTREELSEIKKLPNFDKKIMNELIFGKEKGK